MSVSIRFNIRMMHWCNNSCPYCPHATNSKPYMEKLYKLHFIIILQKTHVCVLIHGKVC